MAWKSIAEKAKSFRKQGLSWKDSFRVARAGHRKKPKNKRGK